MTRTVCVRYLLPVYVTVDLDAEIDATGFYPDEAVSRVFLADENYIRLDHKEHITQLLEDDVLDDAIESDDMVSASRLKAQSREKALDIAERTAWPAWSGS